jgi:hypothetical protein
MTPLFVFCGLACFYDQAHGLGEKRGVSLSVSSASQAPLFQIDNKISRDPGIWNGLWNYCNEKHGL